MSSDISDGVGTYTGDVQPLIEIQGDQCRITVINPSTGRMIFSWTQHLDSAADMAEKIQLMILHRRFES